MKIKPRYDAPAITLDGAPDAAREPFLRQRRRLAEIVSGFSSRQWSEGSRCEGWRVQDVIAHLTATDRYWYRSLAAALAGEPTRLLVGFDPKASPAALVEGTRGAPSQEVLESYLEAGRTLCTAVESLDEGAWDVVGESPVGHVTTNVVLHHALWDSWVHERDILLPLGMTQDHESDEILAALRYVAGLGPAFTLQRDRSAHGRLVLDVSDPDARITVVVEREHVAVSNGVGSDGTVEVTGDAVTILEALSVRSPWPSLISPSLRWLVDGIAEVFESPAAH